MAGFPWYLPGYICTTYLVRRLRLEMSASTTSWIVAGLGAAVTALGRFIPGSLGDGITGFGVAHIVLGLLDMTRPSVVKTR